jgi:hypothetical protein
LQCSKQLQPLSHKAQKEVVELTYLHQFLYLLLKLQAVALQQLLRHPAVQVISREHPKLLSFSSRCSQCQAIEEVLQAEVAWLLLQTRPKA